MVIEFPFCSAKQCYYEYVTNIKSASMKCPGKTSFLFFKVDFVKDSNMVLPFNKRKEIYFQLFFLQELKLGNKRQLFSQIIFKALFKRSAFEMPKVDEKDILHKTTDNVQR